MLIFSLMPYNGTRHLFINKVLGYMYLKGKQVRFVIVGIFNTVLNIALFNIFLFIFHWQVFVANIIAISFSILLSFLLNKTFVFQDRSDVRENRRQLTLFIIITLFSQLIVQQFFLIVFSSYLVFPGEVLYKLCGVITSTSKEFWVYNTAKGIGIVFSLIINFISYDRKIFTKTTN